MTTPPDDVDRGLAEMEAALTAKQGKNMTTALVSMDDMQKMATALVKSKLFGFETPEQAMSIMMIAQAEGRPAALAARDYHVIKGRPALKADAMLARFQQEGGVVEWAEYTDSKVSGRFSHPTSCPKPVLIEWTIDMAKRIGLASRDNWRNYPRAMMRARCVSEGVRTVYPGIAVGIYTVEEVQDFAKEKDITPTSGAADSLSEEQRVKCSELADRVREWMLQGSLTDAFAEIDNAALEPEEKIFLWTHFDSRVRRQLKEESERQKIKGRIEHKDDTINDAQRKRLEARISELKFDRDAVKEYVNEEFGKHHFTELTTDEYNLLDRHLDDMAASAPKAAQQNPSPATDGAKSLDAQSSAAAAPTITADEALALEARCTEHEINVAALKKAAKVERLSMILEADLPRAHSWIDTAIAKRQAA